jgi:ketosteroid isomerase-like protein
MADMNELRHSNVDLVSRYYTLIEAGLLDAQMDPQLGQGEATGKAVDDLCHCDVATTLAYYGVH